MTSTKKLSHGKTLSLLLVFSLVLSVSLSATPPPVPKFAVVVVGANQADPESMHIAFGNTGDRVYSTLKTKGFTDANILYLSWDFGPNPNVDGLSTKANISWGLQTWLRNNLNNGLMDETVVIYFIDHGGVNVGGYFFVPFDNPTNFVYDWELSNWVNIGLSEWVITTNYNVCNIVIETCFSGNLIGWTPTGLSGPNRIVVTATDTMLQAYSWWMPPQIWYDQRPADSNGEAIFSYYFLKMIGAGRDVQMAFNRSFIQTVNEVLRLALLSGGNEQQNPMIDNQCPGQLFW
ncbi:MAG: hypothetical protein KAW12_29755 [Candidatus Aminicenantes bacterium]|nr:hypothetical protein [Candidatus Aminicenantes bacterium]